MPSRRYWKESKSSVHEKEGEMQPPVDKRFTTEYDAKREPVGGVSAGTMNFEEQSNEPVFELMRVRMTIFGMRMAYAMGVQFPHPLHAHDLSHCTLSLQEPSWSVR
jgi:hypothetical protein